MVNTYLRCLDAQEARAGVESIDRTTGCGFSNASGGVMVRSMGVLRGNSNDYSKSSSKMRMELSWTTG